MKLRNKKTGEIKECAVIPIVDGFVYEYDVFEKGKSLAELNEEWEDYEEPKTFWYIRCSGEVYEDESDASTEHGEKHREIGNYFETKEEAEKAAEKLKAWKRLKDKGFRLERWCFSNPMDEAKIIIKGNCVPNIVEELDLLFGGEE